MSTQPRGPHRLPPGRHGIPADQVAANQRERILAALAERVGSAGYAKMTVEEIIQRAGVSRRTFYQHFPNKEEAFLAAYDEAARRIIGQIELAYSSHSDFVASARAALECCLEELAGSPDIAMMGIVEIFSAGPKALERRNAILRRLTGLLAEHTGDLPPSPLGPSLAAETIVGGVLEVIYNRVQRHETGKLPELLPDLLYCVLSPFLGHERAAAEREKAVHSRVR